MSYSNRPSRRAIPDITPYRQPFSPSAYVEAKEIARQKKRKANLSRLQLPVSTR